MLREILPGLFHWSIRWPGWWSLESYWLRTENGGVLIDPLESVGLGELDEADDIQAIFLTVGWHERSARLFSRRTGAPIFLPELDRHMIEDIDQFVGYGDALRA